MKHPILIVTENLRVGGAEKYTVLVANELHARGHRVVVLANDGPFRKHFNSDIRFVRAYFENGILGVVYGAFQMIRICLQERIPVIHAQKLESSRAAWLAKFVTGVPVVKTAHGYTPKELTSLGTTINKYSDKVVTIVDWLSRELHLNGVADEKLSVIYNGMASDITPRILEERVRLRARMGIHAEDPVVLAAARLERGKNFAALIEWFSRVHIEVENAKLVIVGEGPEKNNLIADAKRRGLSGAIIFEAATTHVQDYLHVADVFCTPTIGRGMAVLEAMAAGLPVVGIEPNGPPNVILDGTTGFLIRTDNKEVFAERLTYLLRNPEIAKRFGAAGKRRVEKEFTHTRMVDELEAVYLDAMSEQQPRSLFTPLPQLS